MSDSATKLYLKPALAVFRDRKVLMVRDNVHGDTWLMLGGKQEPGETEIDGLKREVKEEVNAEIEESSLKFLKEFEDVAFDKPNSRVRIRLYTGSLKGEPTPSEEIVEVGYFDSRASKKNLTPISVKIFRWLKEQNYID